MSAAQAIATDRFFKAMGQATRPCSLDEFSDMMARDLGHRYGLNDIREA